MEELEQQVKTSEPDILRLYGDDSKDSHLVEGALMGADIKFTKIKADELKLITGSGPWRGIHEILGYIQARTAIKYNYNIEWE